MKVSFDTQVNDENGSIHLINSRFSTYGTFRSLLNSCANS